MEIYTSYFYQVRFFPVNLVPLSTAAFDPKWYHNNRGPSYQFKDKRGVINGIRADVFAPGSELGGYCSEACGMVPPNCDFLLRYRAQLDRLDFRTIWQKFESLAQTIQLREGLESVNFALLLHEAPTKLCSERCVIQDWFAKNGHPIHEWQRSSI